MTQEAAPRHKDCTQYFFFDLETKYISNMKKLILYQ